MERDSEKLPLLRTELEASEHNQHSPRRGYHSAVDSRSTARRYAIYTTVFVLLAGPWLFGDLLYLLIPPSEQGNGRLHKDWRSHTRSNSSDPHFFNWETVEPKDYLDYTPCYKDKLCARVTLPLDYWNTSNPHLITAAVLKVPAQVGVTHPKYGGVVFVNPGGPGGSATQFARNGGPHLQTLLNGTGGQERYYDMIGIDPRGVGETLPTVSCFDDPNVRASWDMRIKEEGLLGVGDAALGRLFSMSHAYGGSCKDAGVDKLGYDIKEYVSTAYVARDMLEVLELEGKFREQTALEELAFPFEGQVRDPECLMYKPGNETLQYWGFSYGTYLGATFASMFPDRIKRMVVDGVVNAENYAAGLWSDNLHDAEKVMAQFYTTCAGAGPEVCPLADEGSTPEDIKTKLAEIFQSLWHNPLVDPGPTPEVITYSDVKGLIMAMLYSPLVGFPGVARVANDLHHRRTAEMGMFLREANTFKCLRKNVPAFVESLAAISCGDGDDISDWNITRMAAHLKQLDEESPSIGQAWSAHALCCTGWRVRPKYRYTGPWKGETSHPILWVGNTADPVTPVGNARMMVKGYPKSIVLTQDSPGHCSLSAYSKCTTKFVRDYFRTGNLPPPDTVCPVEQHPFDKDLQMVGLEGEEVEKKNAHEGVRRMWEESGFGFGREGLRRVGVYDVWDVMKLGVS